MAKNQYPCTQQELYATAEAAWNLFILHIGDFRHFRQLYSPAYFEKQMTSINEAREIKDRRTLQAELKLTRRELVEAKDNALHYARCLREYIIQAFDEDMANTLIKLLEKKDYTKACNNNWLSCKTVSGSVLYLLRENREALLENDNMPHSFEMECTVAIAAFNDMYVRYSSLIHQLRSYALNKVNSNNRIYKDLTTMLRHAQLVYRDQPEMQALFRFDKHLKATRNNKKIKQAVTKPTTVSFLNRMSAMF